MTLLQTTALAAVLFSTSALAQGMMGQGPGGMGQGTMPMPGMGGPASPGAGSGMALGYRQGWSGFGNMTIDRVEGRLAFLKTELRISDGQLPAWNGFADAVRTNAKTMHVERQFMQGRVGADVSLPDRLAAQANAFAAHAEEMAKLKAALDPLYASLSAEQKKTADEIVFSPMGVPIGPMM